MNCTVEACEKPKHAKGMCQAHYLRLRRWGDLELRKRPAQVTLDLVLRRGRVDRSGNCWTWNSTISLGYGVIGVGGRNGRVWLAHRLVYELTRGHIPGDLIAHHDCHNPRCVNPDHLRLMTRAEHQRYHLPRLGTGKNKRMAA